MSRIQWIDTHQMVTSLDCQFTHRPADATRNLLVRPAHDDETRIDETPGECYVFDRFRGIVIEFKSAS